MLLGVSNAQSIIPQSEPKILAVAKMNS